MNDPVKQIKVKINHYNYIQVIKLEMSTVILVHDYDSRLLGIYVHCNCLEILANNSYNKPVLKTTVLFLPQIVLCKIWYL